MNNYIHFLAHLGRSGANDAFGMDCDLVAAGHESPASIMNVWMPSVIEKTGRGERFYDIYSRLLQERIIFLGTPINDVVANLVIAQMLHLEHVSRTMDIQLFINTPGGSIPAGLAIYDTMQFVRCDVATYGVGLAASLGAVLLAAGAKGKRHALPHSRVVLHQPWGGARGTATDISIMADEILYLKKKVNTILVEHTGQPLEKIEEDTDRDFYMSAEEAKEYGLVDNIVQPRNKAEDEEEEKK